MRKKFVAVVVCAAAIVCVASVSVTGQQEPLPVVTPKGASLPVVYLASDPILDFRPPDIEEAARNNDYATFDALYRAAKERGEDVSRFDTLHELWTWAIGDPIGAFYGRETYLKLARAYPGYADYIAEFAITDSNGVVFWPTSETRLFLISRAGGERGPRSVLADGTRTDRTDRTDGTDRASAKPTRKAVTAPKAVTVAPAVVIRAGEEPALPAAATEAAVVTDTVAQVAAPVAAPAAVAAPVAQVTTTTPAVTRRDNSLANRGILLLVLGLIGVGLLAVIFRTPREEDEQPMAVPRGNVEPIRKAAVPEDEAPRATGSHG